MIRQLRVYVYSLLIFALTVFNLTFSRVLWTMIPKQNTCQGCELWQQK